MLFVLHGIPPNRVSYCLHLPYCRSDASWGRRPCGDVAPLWHHPHRLFVPLLHEESSVANDSTAVSVRTTLGTGCHAMQRQSKKRHVVSVRGRAIQTASESVGRDWFAPLWH